MGVGSEIKEIELGDHLCLLYDSERDKLYTTILFILDGLKDNQLVLVFNEDEDEITGILAEIVDIKRFLEKEQLIFLPADESVIRGFFDSDAMLEMIADMDEKALEEGYKGLRIVGNASWILTNPKVENFLEFEAKLNRFLPVTRCICLCLIDERKFDADLLLRILQVHPKLISGKEVRENINYLPPDKFLRKLRARVNINESIQKLVDRKLRREFEEVEERLKLLFDSSFEAVLVFKGEKLISFNPKAMEIFGINRSVLGKKVSELFDGEELKIFKSRMEYAKQSPQFFEFSFGKKELEISLTKASDKLIAIARDVTDLKNLLKRLEESERKYRELWENAGDILFIVDMEGNFLEANRTARELFGYTDNEVRVLNVRDVVERNYLPLVYEEIEKIGRGERGVSKLELLCITKEGRAVWIESKAKPILENGRIKAIQGIARDVTERKKLEQELRESEELFRTLAEKSLVGIYLIQDGVFRYVNPKMAELWGYSVHELIGKSPLEFIHPDDREKVRRNIERRIRGEIDSVDYVLRMIRKDGKVRYNRVFGSRIVYRGKPAVVGTLLDITEMLELEKSRFEAFKQIEKNIEQFAILVDHIRNPLAAILGLAETEVSDERLRKRFEELVLRIEELIEKLDKGWIESEKVRKFLDGEFRREQ
jgi:PAS domain S-box-containing protein